MQHDRLREKAGRLQANPQLHQTESGAPSPVRAREGETGAEMKPNVLQPGAYRFDEPFEYVPAARVEAILREFRKCADENAQLQKDLAKTQKELAAHRHLAARAS